MSESLREKTCCFTGHRVIPARSLPALAKELEQTLRRLIDAGGRWGSTRWPPKRCCG